MKTNGMILLRKYFLRFMAIGASVLLFYSCKKEISETEVSSSSIYYLKGSNNDKVTRVKPTKDGGFIFCGVSLVGLSNTQAFMLKVDGRGKQQWYKTYGNTTLNTLNDVIECEDGSFVGVGGTIMTWNRQGFGLEYVIKTDANGNLAWERSFTYGTGNISSLFNVVQGKNKLLYATGGFPSNIGYIAPWLVSFDLDGKLIYNEVIEGLPIYKPNYFKFDDPNNLILLNNSRNIGLAINSSNDLLIGSLIDIYKSVDDSHNQCMGLISINGESRKVNFFYPYVDKPNYTSYTQPNYKILPVNDGNLLCYTIDDIKGSLGYPQIHVTKVNLDGVPLWTKKYAGLNSAAIHEALADSDNGLTIVGLTSAFPTNNDFKESFLVANSFVLKLDQNGNEIFSSISNNSTNIEVYKSIQPDLKGGFLVAGYTSLHSTSYHKMFIKRLDPKAQLKF